MELLNFNIMSVNSVSQSWSSQLKQLLVILQQERLVNEFSTKIRTKFCFQTSFKNFKNIQELER